MPWPRPWTRAIAACRRTSCATLAAELLEIPAEIVDAALDLELSDGEVVADTVEDRPCVFLAGLYRAEQSIAERLVGLGAGSPPWLAVDPEKAIPWVERKVGISLAESQKEAVRLALRAKVLVITGGPGVGKTTLVNAILKILQAKTPAIALAAPTGRAAKRMSEATGLEAKTLHRLLEADPGPGRLQAQRGAPARVRPAGGGRGLDGRRAADAQPCSRRCRGRRR